MSLCHLSDLQDWPALGLSGLSSSICIPSFLFLYSNSFLAPSPCFPCKALKQKSSNSLLNFTWSKQNIIHVNNFNILYFYCVNSPFQYSSPFSKQRTSSSALNIHFDMIWNWETMKYRTAVPYPIWIFFNVTKPFNESSFHYPVNPFMILLCSNLSDFRIARPQHRTPSWFCFLIIHRILIQSSYLCSDVTAPRKASRFCKLWNKKIKIHTLSLVWYSHKTLLHKSSPKLHWPAADCLTST